MPYAHCVPHTTLTVYVVPCLTPCVPHDSGMSCHSGLQPALTSCPAIDGAVSNRSCLMVPELGMRTTWPSHVGGALPECLGTPVAVCTRTTNNDC
ncbi:hypothetical protein HaLaN_17012 [Haematococcus lacustris]|uniref:Uncharacterized protein n=1 Tax=Haematococcus lacustris TaxID=44745 RepID=A0A699ZK63_HAELA|nr:hypothetical protein HaLaN_17012 [Haematococcus lacustris]